MDSELSVFCEAKLRSELIEGQGKFFEITEKSRNKNSLLNPLC